MKKQGRVAGVILAGGTSSRMGSAKQLLIIDREPLVVRAVRSALASRLDPVVAVLGHEAGRVRDALGVFLPNPRLVVRENPDYRLGMSESLKRGVEELSGRSVDGAMILLADQPNVTGPIIDRLVEEFLGSEKPICQPLYGDVPGNPVVFHRSLFGSLLEVTGDRGGRSILREHPEWVHVVPFVDPAIGIDIDTPEAYRDYLRLHHEELP